MKMVTRFFCYFLNISVFCLCSCNGSTTQDQPVEVNVPLETNRVIALGRVEPENKITNIGTEVAGVIRKIYSKSGDTVKQGQLLIELNHDYEDAREVQASARIATQQSEIENLKAQAASIQLKTANLKAKFDRLQRMADAGAETTQNVDNARTDYEQSLKDTDKLNAQISAAQKRLEEIAADIKVAAADVERRRVKSPANGVLLSMDLTEGASVSPGTKLFEFAPISAATVLCEVDELFVNKVKLGQKAVIRTQGSDDKLAEGEVIYLGPYLKKKSIFSDDSSNMEDRRVREVRIRLNGNPALLINSRVEAVIQTQ